MYNTYQSNVMINTKQINTEKTNTEENINTERKDQY